MFVTFNSGVANLELKNQAPVSVIGRTFRYVSGPLKEIRGTYILCDTRGEVDMPNRNTKIFIDSNTNYSMSDRLSPELEEAKASETDEQIIERLRKRFEMLDKMTKAAKKGHIRAMIVSGPPGCGKSHGVEAVLRKGDILNTLADTQPKYTFVKGAASAIGLYLSLIHI